MRKAAMLRQCLRGRIADIHHHEVFGLVMDIVQISLVQYMRDETRCAHEGLPPQS